MTAFDFALAEVRAAAYEVPNLIGGDELRTGRLMPVVTPHAHTTILGRVHRAGPAETTTAIDAALAASGSWGRLPPEERTAPFLRTADLLEQSPWRERLVAATMLELSKTPIQAEGDVIAETADMIRANVANFLAVAEVQPTSSDGVRNHLDYRPLEGFVLAVSPFNYASMNHLALGPALLGNVVVWSLAEATALVSHLMLTLLREAGLPEGVTNLVHGDGAEIGAVALAHPDLAAVHFTGRPPRSATYSVRSARTSIGIVATRGWSARRGARALCSRTPRPTSRRSWMGWWTVPSTIRARNARPRAASMCRVRSGRSSATGWWRGLKH